MTCIPQVINEASPIRNFHLLFLSEGFGSSDENDFYSFCKRTAAELFKLMPFNYAKARFDVRACFNPSNVQGTGDTPQDTAYKFFKSASSRLLTKEPGRIIDDINDMAIVIGRDSHDASEIWLNPLTKGSRVVCVVVKSGERIATTQFSYLVDPLEYPQERSDELDAMVPFIAITTWPAEQGSQPVYTNPFAASAAMLAHELGHFFGLTDEWEGAEDVLESYDSYSDIEAPNITTHAALLGFDDDGQPSGNHAVDISLIKQNLKWYSLVSTKRYNALKELSHPSAPDAGKRNEYTRASSSAERAVVLLHHQKLQSDPDDTSTLNSINYYENHRKPLLWMKAPNLIEGGATYRNKTYRPSPECLMRRPGYEKPAPAGKKKFVTIPYCKVCQKHIMSQIAGLYNFKPGGVKLLPDPFYPPKTQMFSRLSEAFARYIQLTENSLTWMDLACVAASYRRFEGFFRKALRWETVHRFNLKEKRLPDDTDTTYNNRVNILKSRWGGTLTVRYPRLMNDAPGDAHLIWTSALKELKQRFALKPDLYMYYAGAGAAGAVAFSGFGKIVNEGEYITKTYKGRSVTYFRYKNLAAADFANVDPGSLIQFWPDAATYYRVMDFIAGVSSENLSSVLGHSTVFMGKNANGELIVADQGGIDSAGEIGDFWQFAIVAQLYDAEGIPPEEDWITVLI